MWNCKQLWSGMERRRWYDLDPLAGRGWVLRAQAQLNLVELLAYTFQACRAAAAEKQPRMRGQGPSQQEALLSATLLLIQAVRASTPAQC
jgi:hypothetical protein